MLWDYFAAGATGALKKVDEIMKMENALKFLSFTSNSKIFTVLIII